MNRRFFLHQTSHMALASLSLSWGSALVSSASASKPAASPPLQLTVHKRIIEVKGKAAPVYGINNAQGGQGLVLEAHQQISLALTNKIAEPTLVHWHGLTPQQRDDGMPDLPLPLMRPEETRLYALPTGQPGTHWMHAHTLQEQSLLAAPLIVISKEDQARDEQSVTLMLHDFSFTPPEALLEQLMKATGHAAMHHHMPDPKAQMPPQPAQNAMMDNIIKPLAIPAPQMMGEMDVNDIAYDAYLANDRDFSDPEVIQVDKNSYVRVRIINGASATGFIISTEELSAEVIAVDGQDIKPLPLSSAPLAMGQRLDLRLKIPPQGGSFPIIAQREGAVERTGIILATKGAKITKLSDTTAKTSPVLDLSLEQQLKALHPLTIAPADQTFEVMLKGSMQPYQWAMETARPLLVQEGQRIAITLHNQSMMAHPMHLHGHHFQVTAINGQPLQGAMRDTVNLPPHSSVTISFDANNKATGWAFHCHHLYHMMTGMMGYIRYI